MKSQATLISLTCRQWRDQYFKMPYVLQISYCMHTNKWYWNHYSICKLYKPVAKKGQLSLVAKFPKIILMGDHWANCFHVFYHIWESETWHRMKKKKISKIANNILSNLLVNVLTESLIPTDQHEDLPNSSIQFLSLYPNPFFRSFIQPILTTRMKEQINHFSRGSWSTGGRKYVQRRWSIIMTMIETHSGVKAEGGPSLTEPKRHPGGRDAWAVCWKRNRSQLGQKFQNA